MKKNFSSYHTKDDSATSLAFIVGYRAEMKAMDFKRMHTYMVNEYTVGSSGSPNRYLLNEEQIRLWNNLFVEHCEEAIALIENNPDQVRKLCAPSHEIGPPNDRPTLLNARQEREICSNRT